MIPFLGSLHREVSKVKSAIRPRPASAASRLNPPSARKREIASGVLTWNCAGPRAASNRSSKLPR
eukprot:13936566-Alexandrium_andersonii.AAC.1